MILLFFNYQSVSKLGAKIFEDENNNFPGKCVMLISTNKTRPLRRTQSKFLKITHEKLELS